jgi:hypothetical protein
MTSENEKEIFKRAIEEATSCIQHLTEKIDSEDFSDITIEKVKEREVPALKITVKRLKEKGGNCILTVSQEALEKRGFKKLIQLAEAEQGGENR